MGLKHEYIIKQWYVINYPGHNFNGSSVVPDLKLERGGVSYSPKDAICDVVDHYSNVIMSAVASQITSVSIVCITVCSGAD